MPILSTFSFLFSSPVAVQDDRREQQQAKEANVGDGKEKLSTFQRKYVKTYDFQYISLDLRPTKGKTEVIEECNIPSRLSIAKSIETSLLNLNGLVNGSFNWDLLHIEPSIEKNFIRVIIKVDSNHLQTLRTTISSGLVIPSNNGNVIFQSRYDRTLSSLDLIALEADRSQDWFDTIVKMRSQ